LRSAAPGEGDQKVKATDRA